MEQLHRNGISSVLTLQALRRRGSWAITLPFGIFQGELRPDLASHVAEVEARTAAIATLSPFLPRYLPPARRMFVWSGDFYFPTPVVGALRHVVPQPALVRALHAFLEAAAGDPTLVKGPRRRRPFVPLEARAVAHHGGVVRGPSWRPEEDMTLRQWFGPRAHGAAAGRHVALTEAEWSAVLARLEGRRTRSAVRARIAVLNVALKRELSVDGYVPRDRHKEYYARVLGENPRRPRLSPLRRRRRP